MHSPISSTRSTDCCAARNTARLTCRRSRRPWPSAGTCVIPLPRATCVGKPSPRRADRMRHDHVPGDVRVGCRVLDQGEDPARHETGRTNGSAAARHLRHRDQATSGFDLDPAAISGCDDVIGADLSARINNDLHSIAPHTPTVPRPDHVTRRRAVRSFRRPTGQALLGCQPPDRGCRVGSSRRDLARRGGHDDLRSGTRVKRARTARLSASGPAGAAQCPHPARSSSPPLP